MKFHPLAGIFPLIEGAEFDALVEDIRKNDLQEPITTYQNLILDGRNRFRACQKAKVKPRFEEYRGSDPLALVISLNVHRRHLNESQRSRVAFRLETTTHGGDRKSDQDANLHLDRQASAKLLNVSVRSVADACVVQNKGIPELGQAVDRGVLAVSRAATVAKRSPEEQKRFLAEPRKKATPKQIRGNKLIRVWDASKVEDQILFLEQRRDAVGEKLKWVNTF